MAKTTTNPYTQTSANINSIVLPAIGVQTIDANGVVSNIQLLYTAPSEGAIVKSLRIASNDAVRYASIWTKNGSLSAVTLLGTVPVPATAGYSATGIISNVDVLGNSVIAGLTYDQSGHATLNLSPSASLYIGMVAAPAAGKALYVSGEVEEF